MLRKILVFVIALLFIGTFTLFIWLLFSHLALRGTLNGLDKIKTKELKIDISRERELIIKELDAKYGSVMSAFSETVKMLNLEKSKTKKIEEMLKNKESARHGDLKK